jgi:hypothetical protein
MWSSLSDNNFWYVHNFTALQVVINICLETNPKYLIKLASSSGLPDSTSLQVRCKVKDKTIAFFPYIISLAQYKKWKTRNDHREAIEAKNSVLFPDQSHTFFCNEKIFNCELKKKQKAWILIFSTPYKEHNKFLIEFTCSYPIEVSYLE